MKKSLVLSLWAAALAAVLLMVLFTSDYLNSRNELNLTKTQLAESRKTWENTAAEKEKLQDQLKQIRDDVKEADLSLRESTERAEELRAEIETLKKDIDRLSAGKQ